MGATPLLIASTALQAGAGAYGSYTQSRALKAQGKYEEEQHQFNARIADINAEDATARGTREAGIIRRRAKQISGSQRAAYSGQGVDVNTGTAAAIQDETRAMSEEDILTAQNNAWREAWGYRAEASNERFTGRLKRIAAKQEAKNTLITGGLQFAGDILGGANKLGQAGGASSGQASFVPKNTTEAKFNTAYKNNWYRTRGKK